MKPLYKYESIVLPLLILHYHHIFVNKYYLNVKKIKILVSSHVVVLNLLYIQPDISRLRWTVVGVKTVCCSMLIEAYIMQLPECRRVSRLVSYSQCTVI